MSRSSARENRRRSDLSVGSLYRFAMLSTCSLDSRSKNSVNALVEGWTAIADHVIALL
jgi:hypothetical protein